MDEDHQPPSPSSGQPAQLEPGYLNDLPSLTPSKPPASSSVSDSDSDSIPERFTDDSSDEGAAGLLDGLSLGPAPSPVAAPRIPLPQRTPASQASLLPPSLVSLSEPAPPRNPRMARKRSLSALVALRYRGGKGDAEIGDEERGLLALDLDTYINSGEPEIPETRALPPTALFPTLSTGMAPPEKPGRGLMEARKTTSPASPALTIELLPDAALLLPTPRAEWPFGGGTGPGKTSRGFIPGRPLNLLSPTTPTPTSSSISSPNGPLALGSDPAS